MLNFKHVYLRRTNAKNSSKLRNLRKFHTRITPRLKVELERLWWKALDKKTVSVFGIATDVKKSFVSACKAADIEGMRFHDLRHTAITRMVQTGMAPALVAKISGHTQPQTFARYVNPDQNIAQQLAASLAAQG